MLPRATPEAFRTLVKSATVPMLPLVDDHSRQWAPGWTTYTDHFENNPDIEVFCGGENEKYATAAAVWRQGNLLHFGFEQTPTELNENGRRLLLNAIAYISRFTEDKPLAVTPSVFAGPAALPRTYIDRRILGKSDLKELEWMLVPELYARISGMRREEMRSWHKENRSYLHPSNTAEKRLEIDQAALALKAHIDELVFFRQCIDNLAGEKADTARKLLKRYAPAGTENLQSRSDWQSWFAENEAYLFFSDQADYRWYIDALAKKRNIPSAQLRGPARASRP
ncbi:MAG: hypothetical protein L0Z50_38255 [Verrucomicrobiales bacterium]|nr:hypothetical protein [Verrucomicrobiales bacterium]